MIRSITNAQFMELAARQHERAMTGDQQAARWCAEHAPDPQVSELWDYSQKLRAQVGYITTAYNRLRRGYDRLHLIYRGMDKLLSGAWQKDSPEARKWADDLKAAFCSEQAFADLSQGTPAADWDPEAREDFCDALADFLAVAAKQHGLDTNKLTSMEQAQRVRDSFLGDNFDSTCREIAAELAA